MMVFDRTKTLSPCFIRINEVFYFFDGGSRTGLTPKFHCGWRLPKMQTAGMEERTHHGSKTIGSCLTELKKEEHLPDGADEPGPVPLAPQDPVTGPALHAFILIDDGFSILVQGDHPHRADDVAVAAAHALVLSISMFLACRSIFRPFRRGSRRLLSIICLHSSCHWQNGMRERLLTQQNGLYNPGDSPSFG